MMQIRKSYKNNFIVIVLLLFTTIVLFTSNTTNEYLLSMTLLTIVSIIKLFKGGIAKESIFDKQNLRYVLWFTTFFVFFALHYSFVHWDDFSFMRSLRIWLPPLIAFVWLSKVNTNDLLEFFGKCCVVASVPIVIMVISMTGLSMVSEGERFGGEDFILNGNTVSVHLLFLSFFSLIYYRKNKKWRIFTLCMLMIMTFVIFITGCRRAIIGIIALFLGYFWVFGKKHRLRSIVMSIATLWVISVLVINVDFLYEIAGYRIEKIFYNLGLISSMGSMDTYDYSAEIRSQMIPIAFMMFYANPIMGNGFAFFIMHSGLNIFNQGYSTHNNYLEILVNYGIVGFILYYSMILYVLVKLLSKWKVGEIQRFLIVVSLIHLIVIEPTTVNFCNYSVFYILYYILYRVIQLPKINTIIVR